MKQQILPWTPSLSWHTYLFLMVTPEFRCRDGIYKKHLASNVKLLCLQPPVESGREHPLQGTLLWCVTLHPSPLSNHCGMGKGRDGIFEKVFFHKAREIGTASCFGMLFAPSSPQKRTLERFCILHTTSCDSCSSRGRQKGNQYC